VNIWACDGRPLHCLEYSPQGRQIRVEVSASLVVAAVEGLYFVREPSFWLLWNYVHEIGLLSVLSKIASRRAERVRNLKYVSIGYARVLEAPDGTEWSSGQSVCFVTPRHPAHVERVWLPSTLLRPHEWELPFDSERRIGIAAFQAANSPSWVADLAGWAPESGAAPRHPPWTQIVQLLSSVDWTQCLTVERSSDIGTTTPGGSPATSGVRNATLFGYGNYAKTVILPSLPEQLSVTRIHEIDPVQIPVDRSRYVWDTSPEPAANDANGVWLIAGFHHTHADLAIRALASGRAAVSEKPLVTNRRQAGLLEQALHQGSGRFFAGFHKRYSPFNEMARQDLAIGAGTPISYHGIVYEVPLPARHWYLWPNSRSRIVSNGCHWLDHFLFLNDYCEHAKATVEVGSDGELNVSVTLVNGAFMSLVLTDRGSPRIGMRDYIELRAGTRTVTIDNGARYLAESPSRVVRRMRMNKMRSYWSMYATIGRRIVDGTSGDARDSVRATNALMLDLDDQCDGRPG
jgi:predicted dehydrogenase